MAVDPSGTKLKWWQWLIAGTVAAISVAVAVATGGVGIAVASSIVGAATGALYGYGVAKATGQDVWESIGIGMLSGITLGNIATTTVGLVQSGVKLGKAIIGNTLASAVVGFGAEILSQISTYDKVVNWGNAFISAGQWGILNTINFGFGKITEPNLIETFIGGYIYNHITGVVGFVIDLIKGGLF